MEYQSKEKNDLMGEFHNEVIALVDKIRLSPPETIAVLRMISLNIEKLFEVSVKGKQV